MNNDPVGKTELSRNRTQEKTFFLSGFYKVNLRGQHDGRDNSGKAGSRTEINPRPHAQVGGNQSDQLCTVFDVPLPRLWKGRRRDQVHPFLPFIQKLQVTIELRLCFT